MTTPSSATPWREANAALAVLALCLVPYLALAAFSVPTADDYLQASRSLDTGITGFVAERYVTWSGRYSSDFLVAAYHVLGHRLTPFFLVDYYFVGPLLCLLLFGAASYRFAVSLAGTQDTRLLALFALATTAGALSEFDLKSTVYWLTGAGTYAVSSACLILSVGTTLRIVYGRGSSPALIAAHLLQIAFVNGLSETVAAAQTAFLCTLIACTLVFGTTTRRRAPWWTLLFPVAAIVSALVVSHAPGNAIRAAAESFPRSNDVLLSIAGSLVSAATDVFRWMNLLWVCLFVLTARLAGHWSSPRLEAMLTNGRAVGIVTLSLLVAGFLSYFVRWFAMGFNGPQRTHSVSYTVFLLLTLIVAVHVGRSGWRESVARHITPRRAFGCAVALGLMTTAANLEKLASDVYSLSTYRSYYRDVFRLAKGAGARSVLEVPAEPQALMLRWKCRLTQDPDYYTNRGFAQYFGLASVTAVGADKPDRECGGVERHDTESSGSGRKGPAGP